MARGRPLSLKAFIGRQIANGATTLILHRCQPNGALGVKVERFRLDTNTAPEHLSEVIEGITQSDAEVLNQRQAYSLKAMEDAELVGSFSLSAEPAEGSGEAATEPATRDGSLAMMMRHLENKERMMLAVFQEMGTQSARQAEMFDRVLDTMRKGFEAGLEARGELASKSLEAETAAQIEVSRLEIQRDKDARMHGMMEEAFKLMGPMIAQKMLGDGGDSKPKS